MQLYERAQSIRTDPADRDRELGVTQRKPVHRRTATMAEESSTELELPLTDTPVRQGSATITMRANRMALPSGTSKGAQLPSGVSAVSERNA
jgi:hypothetical protein